VSLAGAGLQRQPLARHAAASAAAAAAAHHGRVPVQARAAIPQAAYGYGQQVLLVPQVRNEIQFQTLVAFQCWATFSDLLFGGLTDRTLQAPPP
jgi:hypothetical protein